MAAIGQKRKSVVAPKGGPKAAIEQRGITYQKFPGFDGAFAVFRAPEGTMLHVFDESFPGLVDFPG
jgi:hypothetical protein